MTTPTVIELRRNGNPVGERVELRALVADYMAQSQRLNAIPMACSLLDLYLENLP
jgi:hypothetical protein